MSNEVKIEGKRSLLAFGTVKVSGAAITSQNVVGGGSMVQSIPGVYIYGLNQINVDTSTIQANMSLRQGVSMTGCVDVGSNNITFNTFDNTAAVAARNFDFEIWQLQPG